MTNPIRQVRLSMRQQRRDISKKERCVAAHHLSLNIFHHTLFLSAKNIACYLENDGEISLNPVIQRIWQMRKQCYLPVLHPYKRSLWFLPYNDKTRLRQNRFGILEPSELHLARPAWALDLVLTPLVAFDDQGNRLGMGGGFYDSSFAYLKSRRFQKKPKLLGTAFECQHLTKLPQVNQWDVPLHGVVTEVASYQF